MRHVPLPLRDLGVGLLIVSAVLAVVQLVDADAWTWSQHWMLLPLGAGLFMMRQAVRRAVLARVDAERPGGAGDRSSGPPAEPRTRRGWDDPLRAAGLAALLVVGLLVLVML